MSVKVVNSGTGEKCTIDGKPIDGELKLKTVNNHIEYIDSASSIGRDEGYTYINLYLAKLREENKCIRIFANSYNGTIDIVDLKNRRLLSRSSGVSFDTRMYLESANETKNYFICWYEDYQYIFNINNLTTLRTIRNNSANYISPERKCVDFDLNEIYTIQNNNNNSDIYKYKITSDSKTKIISIDKYSADVMMCKCNNDIYILKRGNGGNKRDDTLDYRIFKISGASATQIGTCPSNTLNYGYSEIEFCNGFMYWFSKDIIRFSLNGTYTNLGENKISINASPRNHNGKIYISSFDPQSDSKDAIYSFSPIGYQVI